MVVASSMATASAKERPTDGLWVTFDVVGERFRAVVTEPQAVGYVLGYVAGHEPQRVPIGIVVRGGQFNAPWSWHLQPSSIEFADHTTELCDGTPSYLEANLDEWISKVVRYCPWSAKITQVHDCRDGKCRRLKGTYGGRTPAF